MSNFKRFSKVTARRARSAHDQTMESIPEIPRIPTSPSFPILPLLPPLPKRTREEADLSTVGSDMGGELDEAILGTREMDTSANNQTSPTLVEMTASSSSPKLRRKPVTKRTKRF